ncbi:hypothetical protein RHSIM_Rhsim10G0118500 [Rhododendron simsii]|uniref:40S ribosomal protein S30 n=1 Tax=Rhododendron simsii TaxID=118357 RepID=A0A834GBK7_RHOSS|nr:hypothetical protein RHSIM_Rhsim10G0118500 [Rhododendron simsii]
MDSGDHLLRSPLETILLDGNVHGSLARAGKVRGQTLKEAKQDKKKKPSGRAHKRMQYDRRFVTSKRLGSAGSHERLMEKQNRLSDHISKHNYRCVVNAGKMKLKKLLISLYQRLECYRVLKYDVETDHSPEKYGMNARRITF